ncbi:hypothetical protein HYH03_017822 [Edaphochlamys debaryana]|uniref:Uncharacterized protein n=1 Tax=Edaphochlamys debaryana TaxID=47281 RepID=A0A835XJB2_9CHLO|nr:hypothetical protein HYH03_017822 [Edaphochlamys debaryana]|eukprot:KAG2483321.1 hypothetical protein HYH03_017822 [Edaphochlamys debaryana]
MLPDITECAKFFDHLVELVPAKYYYDDDLSRENPRHLAKAAREALKADVKFKAKVAKREKLDPDKVATTLEVQRRKSQAAAKGPEPAAGADAGAPSTSGRPAQGAKPKPTKGGAAAASEGGDVAAGLQLQLSAGAASRQELLERLHRKVEEARKRRKVSSENAAEAKEWRQKALRDNVQQKQQQQLHQAKAKQGSQAGGKRKQGEGEGAEGGVERGKAAGKQQRLGAGGGAAPQPAAKKARREGAGGSGGEEDADFKFARIELEGRERPGKAGAKRPPKAVLLKQAEAQRAELEALAGTEEGKAKAHQAAWKAALARAAGDKVLDDPKLLRRSLKREKKTREKHGKAWKERQQAQQEAQAARQSKRQDNLSARRQTKLDNKKAKREKKLLRPGFEGRKEGFIATGGGGAK